MFQLFLFHPHLTHITHKPSDQSHYQFPLFLGAKAL